MAALWRNLQSPRVRGNRRGRPARRACKPSIPACTGEPNPVAGGPWISRFNPRVYGGTQSGRWRTMDFPLQSPRVLGNPIRSLEDHGFPASIPACTGEPNPVAGGPWISRFNPRVYGGTQSGRWRTMDFPLQSPRVRGNPLAHLGSSIRATSIPACAWEPARKPRRPEVDSSIPACAGEPSARSPCRTRVGFNPRVCGGTVGTTSGMLFNPLQSPRVRGNRAARGSNAR